LEKIIFTSLQIEDLQKIIAECLQGCLKEINLNKANQALPDRWLNVDELCEYLPNKPKRQTIYIWVHNSIIPYHKRSLGLYFLRSEVDKWLKEGRRKTVNEISVEAEKILANKKGGRIYGKT
jgi:hypothetical protein